jgi:hypothetical protein
MNTIPPILQTSYEMWSIVNCYSLATYKLSPIMNLYTLNNLDINLTSTLTT